MLNNNDAVVAFLNSQVGALFARKGPVEGNLFGVELEVEGRNVAMEGIPSKNWKRVEEGSLRGESIEYVFSAPCPYDEAVKRVDRLFATFKKHDVVLKNSYRTSTHVHLNFSDKTVKQAILFFFLHTILEEVFEVYCGEQRKGNLFCLSTRDNEELVESLEKAIFGYQNFRDFGENIRYCAANLAALNKFGTIEIRTMRGADTAEQVNAWLNILNQLYEFALNTKMSPVELVEQLSFRGAAGFLSMIFDEDTVTELMKTWPPAMHLHVSLLNGVRLLQMLAYRLESLWSKVYEEKKVEPRPNYKVAAGGPNFYVARPEIQRKIQQLADGDIGMGARDACDFHGRWWWMYEIENDNIEGIPVTYNKITGLWMTLDGEPIRFTVRRGEIIEYGTEEDLEVNFEYYRYFDLLDDHPANNIAVEDDFEEDDYDPEDED
jgi:hypothetical protein